MTAASRDRLARLVVGMAPVVFLGLVGGIVLDVAHDGYGQVDRTFMTEVPAEAGRAGGIASILAATGWVLLIGVGAALPLGLAAGVYLAEFGRAGLRTVRGALDLLSAVPSVVYGLFGMAFFCETLKFGWSLLAGGLTVDAAGHPQSCPGAAPCQSLRLPLALGGRRAHPRRGADRTRVHGAGRQHSSGLFRWAHRLTPARGTRNALTRR